MDYQILTADSALELESDAAGLIANGWVSLGGVSVGITSCAYPNEREGGSYVNEETIWAQAMTRQVEIASAPAAV